MTRYACIHGHFYQPQRENPWLETIELQDSAYPHHDWNERITTECYEPNAAARILDGEDHILSIANNYARISFNFGPTLLGWMEAKAPDVYRAILDADRQSRERFSGHGNAIAQTAHHSIMPLNNRRDKVTQVRWGIADFRRRFQRDPEGMWLPETAVDLETLDILAEHGIAFTVLAPAQAARTRENGREWRDVKGARIDPKRAYRQALPSGRSIALFFYDGPVSRGVAFENLLARGENLAERLLGLFDEDEGRPQLVHIATDGETYGHHHRMGDMALAYALHYLDEREDVALTNYGEYLERHPPEHEVEILENTSWSCVHGVERWRSDCGCNTGRQGWRQAWRGPLREALDWLRDETAGRYERAAAELFRDPWAARDAYVDVIGDRSPERVGSWLAEHGHGPIEGDRRVRALELLELQRHAMLMYTSCGWFFDEISGIETTQVLQYAGRLIQLARDLFGDELEGGFLERLERAPSNVPEHGNGRAVYEKFVRPSMVDLRKVGAHYALSAPFETYGDRTEIYAFLVEPQAWRAEQAGRARVLVGKARITSRITERSELLTFGAVHFGDHNMNGGVRPFQDDDAFRKLSDETIEAFRRADLPNVVRVLDHYFEGLTYSLKTLFRDEQRKVVGLILDSTLESAEAVYRHLYESHAPLMRFLADIGAPQPRALQAAAELVLNGSLRRELEDEGLPDLERVRALLDEARHNGVPLDGPGLGYAFERSLEETARRFREQPDEFHHLERLAETARLARDVPFEVGLWKTQNTFYAMMHEHLPRFRSRAQEGDEVARSWVEHFEKLGALLAVRV